MLEMPQEIPEKLSEHVSVVKVDTPPKPPYCVDVDFEADFPDGCSVRIRARLPRKPAGAPPTDPLLSDEHAIVSRAMNLLLRTLRELEPAG